MRRGSACLAVAAEGRARAGGREAPGRLSRACEALERRAVQLGGWERPEGVTAVF